MCGIDSRCAGAASSSSPLCVNQPYYAFPGRLTFLTQLDGHPAQQEKDEKERRRKEKAEAHLYTQVRVSMEADMRRQVGTDVYFDLVDHDKVHTLKVAKKTPWGEVKTMIQAHLGVPRDQQQYWRWTERQNKTVRPSQPVVYEDDVLMQDIKDSIHGRGFMSELRVFLDPSNEQPRRTRSNIMLFFKYYDPMSQRLMYVGKTSMPRVSKLEVSFPCAKRFA